MNEVTAWIEGRVPMDEDLTPDALSSLATDLGGRRELWGHLVRHSPDERVYSELYRDIHLDVWLICWDDKQDTGFHDHESSSGAVYVVDGELAEDRIVIASGGVAETSHRRSARTAFEFDSTRIHCVRNPGGGPAVSVHAYSPALWRMGFYTYDGDGNLVRTPVTYADEMWARPSGLADLAV